MTRISRGDKPKSGSDDVQGPTYDDGHWPIFIVRMPRKEIPRDAYIAFLDRVDSQLERGEPFGIIFDGRFAAAPNAEERRLMAERMIRAQGRYPGRVRGVAIVTSSAIQRGVITAIQWLAKSSHPVAAFSNEAEAIDWLKPLIGVGGSSAGPFSKSASPAEGGEPSPEGGARTADGRDRTNQRR